MARRTEATVMSTADGTRSKLACESSWQRLWRTINWLSNWVIKHQRKSNHTKSMLHGRARAQRSNPSAVRSTFTALTAHRERSQSFTEPARSAAATTRSTAAGTSSATRETAVNSGHTSSRKLISYARTFYAPRPISNTITVNWRCSSLFRSVIYDY